MSSENLFSTKRESTLTGSQMLENMINQKAMQRQNMMALEEAKRLSESTPDFTATMEAANLETENNLKKNIALENAQYYQGSRNIARQQLQMRSRLITEGMDFVRNKVLGEIIYESYWLDEPVKEATVEQISDSIGKVLTYVSENFDSSKVPESKQSKLLKNVNEAIEGIVREATDRLILEAKESNDAFTEFNLTEEEEDKLDDKLTDLGRDEIVDAIKNKVVQTVQDEKEKGEEKSKLFDEIDQASTETEDDDNDEGDEPTDEAEEAMVTGIYNGEIALEGTNINTLKTYFSNLRKRGSRYCKEANKLYKHGKYEDAAKKYNECRDIFKDIEKRIEDLDDTVCSTILSWLTLGYTKYTFFVDFINTRGGASPIEAGDAYRNTGGSWNVAKTLVLANVKKMIIWCENRIKLCNKNLEEEKTGEPREYKYSLESALKVGSNDKFTPSERYILNILESGAPFNTFEDPSWGEFKCYVSMICKKIRDAIVIQKYEAATTLIDELSNRLSNVPEDIPTDVKDFTLSMVGMIYGAVPVDEVIISRLGTSMGSPDLGSNSHAIDMTTISWVDVLVNIKTNLSSIKDYCVEKSTPGVIDNTSVNNSDCPVSGRDSLASMIATNQSRIMARNMGGSLFEALMLSNLSATDKVVTESSSPVSDEDVEDAALIETLLQYTILETLDTIGLYKFRLADVNKIKQSCMRSITEGTTPIYGDGDKETVGMGNDATGKKVVRINTQKMKRRSMKPSET